MLNRIFFAFVFCIFLLGFTTSLELIDLQNKAQELYLLNPLDNSETITKSNFVYLDNVKYWFSETNNDFFILNDKNYKDFVNSNDISKISKTYFFFSKINSQNNKQLALFFNTIPQSTNQYNYNILLILKQLETNNELDNNVYVALTNIQSRVKEIGEISIELTRDLMYLDSNLVNPNYDNYLNIKKINEQLKTNSHNIQQKLYELNQNNNQLLIVLVDANINSEMKTIIPNQTQALPNEFQNIPEYLSYLNKNIETNADAITFAESINQDTLKNNWNLRLERVSFFRKYLTYDKELDTKTKQKNIKELFDLILAQKDVWKELEKTKAFIAAYNNMYSDIEKKDFPSAERQIKPLKDVALQIYNVGRKEYSDTNVSDQILEDETKANNNRLILYIIIGAVALIAIIFGINLIKKIKKANANDSENKEQEVNIDFR